MFNMKKGLTIAALSALSLSAVAVAPAQQASAAETTPESGFYNIQDKTFTSLTNFKKLSKAAKKALFANQNVHFVSGGAVTKALDVILKTNAELKTPAVSVPLAEFEAKNGNIIDAIANPKTLAVESVRAINKTKVEVKFTQAVDTVTKENFTIAGKSVTGATLSEDKKTATLEVSGLTYASEYTVAFNGLKSNGTAAELASKAFTTPAVTDAYELKVTPTSATVTANGADNTVVKFELLDKETGLVDTNADNIVLAIDSTFGNLANSRVTVQNGVGQVVLSSEFSTKQEISRITAQIIEASVDYQDLRGKVSGEATVTFQPSATETDINAVTFVDAESNQADRVVLYFDKAVSPETFVKKNTDGSYEVANDVQKIKEGVTIKITQGTETVGRDIVGFRSVEGNTKAIEVLLDTTDYLTDNKHVTVDVTLGNTQNKKSFTLTDSRQPEFTSVTPSNLKTLDLKFSESVAAGQFRIDGIWSQGNQFKVDYGTFDPKTGIDKRDTATVTLNKDGDVQRYFTAGNHSITVTNLSDYAGKTDAANVSTSQTLNFNVAADATAPTATVSVESQEQFRVTFNKEVAEDAADVVATFNSAFKVYDSVQKKYVALSELKKGKDNVNVFKNSEAGTGVTLADILTVTSVKNSNNEFVVELKDDWTQFLNTSQDAVYNYKFAFEFPEKKFTNATNGVQNAAFTLDLNTTGSRLNGPDNVSPEISSISATDAKDIYKVIMSEPVKLVTTAAPTTSLDEAGATLSTTQNALPVTLVEFQGKDADGKAVVVTGTVTGYADENGADKAFSVQTVGDKTLQELVQAGYDKNWKVVVTSISDDSGKTSGTLTEDFTVVIPEGEDTKFRILSTENKEVTENKVFAYNQLTNSGIKDSIEVTFSKAVVNNGGASDLTSVANWTLNGQKLTDVYEITVADADENTKNGYETVIITFNSDSSLKSNTNVIAVNKNILSLDGTLLTGKYEVVAEDAIAPVLTSVLLADKNTTVREYKATLSPDKLTATIDLTDLPKNLTVGSLEKIVSGQITSNEDVTFKVTEFEGLTPDQLAFVKAQSQKLLAEKPATLTGLTALFDPENPADGVGLEKLQLLAPDGTLTVTGTLTDQAGNVSTVTLNLKVNNPA